MAGAWLVRHKKGEDPRTSDDWGLVSQAKKKRRRKAYAERRDAHEADTHKAAP